MGKSEYFNQSKLKDAIAEHNENKKRFMLVLEKLIEFRKEQEAGKASYQAELARMQNQVKEEYQQTLDDSVFDKLEQFKKDKDKNSEVNLEKEGILFDAAKTVAAKLSRSAAMTAEEGSQLWAKVADEVLEKAEQEALFNMMTVLYIRKKVNNGNYPESDFFDQIGLQDLGGELEETYKKHKDQIGDIKKLVINNLPEIPRSKIMQKHPCAIIDALYHPTTGTPAYPWQSVTTENMIREI